MTSKTDALNLKPDLCGWWTRAARNKSPQKVRRSCFRKNRTDDPQTSKPNNTAPFSPKLEDRVIKHRFYEALGHPIPQITQLMPPSPEVLQPSPMAVGTPEGTLKETLNRTLNEPLKPQALKLPKP